MLFCGKWQFRSIIFLKSHKARSSSSPRTLLQIFSPNQKFHTAIIINIERYKYCSNWTQWWTWSGFLSVRQLPTIDFVPREGCPVEWTFILRFPFTMLFLFSVCSCHKYKGTYLLTCSNLFWGFFDYKKTTIWNEKFFGFLILLFSGNVLSLRRVSERACVSVDVETFLNFLKRSTFWGTVFLFKLWMEKLQ